MSITFFIIILLITSEGMGLIKIGFKKKKKKEKKKKQQQQQQLRSKFTKLEICVNTIILEMLMH